MKTSGPHPITLSGNAVRLECFHGEAEVRRTLHGMAQKKSPGQGESNGSGLKLCLAGVAQAGPPELF